MNLRFWGTGISAVTSLLVPLAPPTGAGGNAPPLAPTDLALVPTGANLDDVLIEWDTQTPGATYEVEYSTDGVTYAPLTTTAADATSYTHTNPTLGEATHYYRVRAVDGEPSAWVDVSLMGWTLKTYPVWKLDEASGNRADSATGHTATDNNTVGSATGNIYALAANFIAANTEYLELLSNADIALGDTDWTIALWLYPNDFASGRAPLGKWGGAGTDLYTLVNTNGTFRFQLHGGGGDIEQGSIATLTAAAWNLVILKHNAATNFTTIRINGGTAETEATGASLDAWGVEPLWVGAWAGGQMWDGRQGQLAISHRVWSDAEDADYWNAGAGRAYPY